MEQIPSFRNVAFTSLIRVNGRQYEFNFRKLPVPGNKYETDVTDNKGERIMFIMHQEQGEWRAQGALVPAWIEQNTAIIGENILSGINRG